MTRTFKADPFETSPEEIERRTAEERAKRLARREREEDRHWEEGTGPASDGRVLNGIGNASNRLMDGPLADMARGAGFEDPDAEMGGFVAGMGEKMRGMRGGKPEPPEIGAVSDQPAPDDTPPIQLRMPR